MIGSRFDAVGNPDSSTVWLGRAWDQSAGSLSDDVGGSSPSGKAPIRDSVLGGHIRKCAP